MKTSIVYFCLIFCSFPVALEASQNNFEYINEFVNSLTRSNDVDVLDSTKDQKAWVLKIKGGGNTVTGSELNAKVLGLCKQFGGVNYGTKKPPELDFTKDELVSKYKIDERLIDKYGTRVSEVFYRMDNQSDPLFMQKIEIYSVYNDIREFGDLARAVRNSEKEEDLDKVSDEDNWWKYGGVCSDLKKGDNRIFFDWTLAFSGKFSSNDSDAYLLLRRGDNLEEKISALVHEYYEKAVNLSNYEQMESKLSYQIQHPKEISERNQELMQKLLKELSSQPDMSLLKKK